MKLQNRLISLFSILAANLQGPFGPDGNLLLAEGKEDEAQGGLRLNRPPPLPSRSMQQTSENLALNGVPSASCVSHGGSPWRMIDGNRDSRWGGRSIAHTCYDPGSWLQVDLGGPKTINHITIFNRLDCCSARLSNAKVEIMNSDGDVVDTKIVGNAENKPSVDFDIGDVEGSIVRVTVGYDNLRHSLQIAELEVYGSSLRTEENYALQGVASASCLAHGGAASRMIDGNRNNRWAGRSIAHTCHDEGAWLQVDLIDPKVINEIVIYNRMDCCSARLSDAIVEIMDSDGTVHDRRELGNMEGIPIVRLDYNNVSGSIVRVTANFHNGRHSLQIAELEVFGDDDRTDVNLALQGEGLASCVSHGGVPSRMIDGDTNNRWAGRSIAHTCNDQGAWLAVDLHGPKAINEIVIYNRMDCCSGRLSNAKVEILDSSQNVVVSKTIGDARQQPVFVFYFKGITGSMVRVTSQNGGESLQIAELQVYGLENASLLSTTTASSSCVAFGGVPQRLIDGNTNNQWRGFSIAHTCKMVGAWMEVNLGEEKAIEDVKVYNRMDCCWQRLSNSVVQVLDSAGNVQASRDIGIADKDQPVFEFNFDGAVGSKVRVTSTSGKNDYLNIAEIEIFERLQGLTMTEVRFDKMFYLPLLDATPQMTSSNYPLSVPDYEMISTKTNAISVVAPFDPEVKYDLAALIDELGGPPTHPTNDVNNDFWSELEEVVDYQIFRRANENAPVGSILPEYPAIWEGLSVDDGAEAVHDEYPGYWQGKFIETLAADGLQIDNTIIPKRSQAQFLHGIVMLADLNTWSIRAVGPNSFGCKWYAGRARPEEVAWLIADDQLTAFDGVPKELIRKIKSMNLVSATDFTAYPEGSPRHPSWPAMHSAASQASLWLSIVLNLTDDQIKEARKVDNAVAMARTIAGVHYKDDNIFGLNLGQKVVVDQLADYLHEVYGSDKTAVNEKIERMKFTWPVDLS